MNYVLKENCFSIQSSQTLDAVKYQPEVETEYSNEVLGLLIPEPQLYHQIEHPFSIWTEILWKFQGQNCIKLETEGISNFCVSTIDK